MIGAALLLLAFGLDGHLGLWDCALLLAGLVAYTVFLVRQSRNETQATRDEYEREVSTASGWDSHWVVQLLLIGVGLALLVLGSEWLVDAAVGVARALGVSDLVIGLTVVAAGTSMPEVATSIMAALRRQRDIAIGNAVGSSTFNILGCLGLTGLVAPDGIAMAPAVLNFDIWVMLAVCFACLPIFLTGREIARWEGALFLAYYVAYVTYLVLRAQQHEALPAFSSVMLGFAVPLTVVTLVVVLMRRGGAPGPAAGGPPGR